MQRVAASSRPFRLEPPPPPVENDVKRACLALLRRLGYWARRHPVGKYKTPDGRWIQIGEEGEPDWIVLHSSLPGFLLELKRPGGVLSPVQHRKIAQLKNGYRLAVAVVDSSRALADWLAARLSTQHVSESKPPDDKSGGV
jgi:hypothetical protein